MRPLAGELLEIWGHEVHLAYDGLEGVVRRRAAPSPEGGACSTSVCRAMDGYQVAAAFAPRNPHFPPLPDRRGHWLRARARTWRARKRRESITTWSSRSTWERSRP